MKLPASGTRALKIETRRIDSTSESDWADISLTCFTESLDPVGTSVLLTPVRQLPGAYEYRVTQVRDGNADNLLLCDLPIGPTIPVVDVVNFEREFRFTVCDSISLGDAETDGVVNFADVSSVLTNWGFTDCLRMGDADRDGDRDFADVTMVLQKFGSTYCATSSQSVAKPADGFATMDLDRSEESMTAAAAAMLVTDALNQLGYASIEAFGDAIAQMDEPTRTAEIRRLGELLGGAP